MVKLSAEKWDEMMRLYGEGVSVARLAVIYGVPPSYVYKKRHELNCGPAAAPVPHGWDRCPPCGAVVRRSLLARHMGSTGCKAVERRKMA
jgi:hypothetical protein